jgi:hypothetical protein
MQRKVNYILLFLGSSKKKSKLSSDSGRKWRDKKLGGLKIKSNTRKEIKE